MSEPGCLFYRDRCEIPADFIHRDDRSVVIRDINPQAPRTCYDSGKNTLIADDARRKMRLIGALTARSRPGR